MSNSPISAPIGVVGFTASTTWGRAEPTPKVPLKALKWPQMTPKTPNTANNDPKWPQVALNGSKWPQMTPNTLNSGPKWP